jgi:multiple sugar transport system permease protein
MAVIGTPRRSLSGTITRRLDRLSERRFALLVSVPALLLVAIFVLPPILAVFGLSFFRIELAKDTLTPFVGLRNFLERLPIDDVVLQSIPRTLGFAAIVTAVTIPLALLTALILNRSFRGSGVFLMAVMLPWAVASVVAGVFWRFIFDTHFGVVNGVLIGLGLISEPINWLQNSTNAVIIAVVATAWRSVPLLTLLLLAALRTIPSSHYRAARMDGATGWETFRWVVLPAIRPTVLVVAVLQIIVGLQVFDLLFSLTSGGPGRETYVLIYAIYDKAFTSLSFGYAAALTVVLFLIIVACSLLLVLLQVRRRKDSVAAESDEVVTPALSWTTSGRGDRFAALAEQRFETGPRKRRINLPPIAGRVAFAVTAGLLLFFFAAPIIWVAISSVQPERALTVLPPQLTFDFWLDGYQTIYGDPLWFSSLLVSLQVAIITTVLVIILSAPAAYVLARFDLPGKKAILGVLIFTQMVPGVVMAIPVLRMFQILDITDTVAALVLVNVAFWVPLVVWLLRNFFADVSVSLEKAARIDGCSRLGSLFRVIVPAASPGIAATSILLLIGTWNEFLFAVVLGQRDAITITRRIVSTNSFGFGETLNQTPPPNMLASAGIVAVLPCILLVLLFHRRIIAGLTEGLVKG